MQFDALVIAQYANITELIPYKPQTSAVKELKALHRCLDDLKGQCVQISNHLEHKEHAVFPYLLKGLVLIKPHQVWQVDITYLRTTKGFMYLVAIIDMYSRMIVGYRLSNSLCTESCKSALEDAILKYGAPVILNSDQGSQFTS